MCVRKVLFVGLYRKRAAGGNILLLVFECWNLGLTLGTMLARLAKLVVISGFYIGRLDSKLLMLSNAVQSRCLYNLSNQRLFLPKESATLVLHR